MTNPIREFWLENNNKNTRVCPAVKCADGFTMSVQAGYIHWCEPMMDLADGNYQQWEVGYPSEAEPLLEFYGSALFYPTEQYYGYVHTQIVNEIIAKHSGIVGPASVRDIHKARKAYMKKLLKGKPS